MAADPAPHLIWNVDEMPTDLRSPILIAAFEGWNDAGEASSTAARYVRDHFEAEHVATIDAEDFFDFTVARPNVCIDDNDARQIVWPSTGIHVARIPGSAHDLVCAIGHEPQLRWRTFVDHLAITAEAFGATGVVVAGGVDPYNPKLVRAAAGSSFRVPFAVVDDPMAALRILEEAGYGCWATIPRGGLSPAAVPSEGPVALILGNEPHGLSDEVVAACVGTVSVPTVGGVDSLNVAIAGSIALHDLAGRKP